MNRTLEMTNEVSEIGRLAEFVENVCEELGLDMGASFNIDLALEEAVSNVINYAYGESTGCPITLSVSEQGGDIVFTLVDEGKVFDPLQSAPDVDTTLSAEERNIGGLGIFLIKNIMHSVEYHREGDRNVLVMNYQR